MSEAAATNVWAEFYVEDVDHKGRIDLHTMATDMAHALAALRQQLAAVVAERDRFRDLLADQSESCVIARAERDALARDMQGVRAVCRWLDAERGSAWGCVAVDGDGGFFAQKYGWHKFPTADSLPALGHKLLEGGHVDERQ